MAKKKVAKKRSAKKTVAKKRASRVARSPRGQGLPGIGDDPVNGVLEELALTHEDGKATMRTAKEEIKAVMRRHKMSTYRRGRFKLNVKHGAETVSVTVKPDAVDASDEPDDEVPF